MLSDLNAGAGITAAAPPPVEKLQTAQAQLFSSEELVIQEILALHPDKTTPLDALTALTRWKKELSGNGER
jgi:hypothetical protein